jgi:hypothetical protein
VLDDHGFVPPVANAPNEALRTAAAALVGLVNDWDDRVADRLFTDNVAPDESYERRAGAARDVVAHGPLTLEQIEATLDTDATAIARAGDGHEVKLWFALSPLREARIQEYTITAE